jgi:putrescine transport system permease protein
MTAEFPHRDAAARNRRLVIASFVTGPSATTLPMAVFSSVRLGVSSEVNALATLFLVVVVVLVSPAF